ncbi:hypothetical protein BX666DRAFT_1881735 [Dichotomocladium elegans]|nr:hypothetical protein BX666DRAFT_1881735 [Dichotomocladium elegans]
MQQQTVQPRFRATQPSTSNITALLTGSPDQRSTTPFSASDHLDGIFQAVRQQVERWGEHAKWKIELVLLNQQTPSSAPNLPHLVYSNKDTSIQDQFPQVNGAASLPRTEVDKFRFRPLKASQRESITRSEKVETWDMPYAADLRQSLKDSQDRQRYLEGVIQAQGERIRQLQMHKKESPMTALQTLHNMTTSELKEQHRVEMKLQQKRIDILALKFKRIAATLERIERMGLEQGDAELDRDQLLEERRVLVRKLHLAELRLNARDAELSYLQNTLWKYKGHSVEQQQQQQQQHESDEDDEQMSPTTGSITQSPYFAQKGNSPKQQMGVARPQPSRPISALDSLSMLADQMLSDPDFGSEGKDSMSSPDVHENERKRRRRTAPFRRVADPINDAKTSPAAHGITYADNPNLKNISATSADGRTPLSPMDCTQTPPADVMSVSENISREPLITGAGKGAGAPAPAPAPAAPAAAGHGQILPPISYPRSPLLPAATTASSSNRYSCDAGEVSSNNRTCQQRNEADARQSPSIAALLDCPSSQQQMVFRPSSAFRSINTHQMKHITPAPPSGNISSGSADSASFRSTNVITSPLGSRGHSTTPSIMSPIPSAYHGPLSPSSTSSPQSKRKWSLELHDHHHSHPM